MPKFDALFAKMSSASLRRYISEYIWLSSTTSLVLGTGALPVKGPLPVPPPPDSRRGSHLRPEEWGGGQAAPRSFLRLRSCLPFVWLPPLSPWLLIISIFLVFQTNKCHYQAVGNSRRLQALPLGLN